jgi:predicted nucleic acid-binding protein
VTAKVVDASAIVALLFDERTRDEVLPRLRDVSLHAPSLLAFEVASACLKKIRAAPAEREALLQAFGLFDLLSIELQPIDLAQALVLAEQSALTIYDASYLWLAQALGGELVTLDRKLARADKRLRGS